MAAENFKVKKGLEVGTGITATSSGIKVTGIVTATQFVGDGSGLTGVVGSGSGVVVKDEGSAVGTAGTINFVGSGVVATLSAGIATVTISGGGGGTLSNIVEDTTPQLGGNLDLNSKIINGSGNIDYTGNLKASGVSTATGGAFFGLIQAGLTGLNATIQKTDNSSLFFQYNKPGNIEMCQGGGTVQVKNNFSVVGLSTMTGGAKLGQLSVGYDAYNVTVQPLSGNNTLHFNYDNGTTIKIGNGQTKSDLEVNGDITPKASGNRDLGLSTKKWRYLYADSANITGIATFTSGVAKLLFNGTQKLETTGTGIAVPNISVSGVGTFSTRIDTNGVTFGTNSTTFAAKFADNAVANFGTHNDLKISHDDNDATIVNSKGSLRLQNDTFIVLEETDGTNLLRCDGGGAVNLYFNGGSPKLVTDTGGVKITGVATATSFSGSAAGLTNIPSAQLSGALPALDGSALTGVTASGSGVIVQHDGSNVGTAGTINFSTNLDVSPVSAGIVTITASSGSGDKIEEGDTKVETVDSGDAADAYVTTEVNGTEEIRTIGGQTTIKYLRVGSAWNMANSTGTGISLNYSNTHDLISSSASSGLDIRSNASIELGQDGSPNYKYAEFRNTQGIFKTNNVERLRYAAGGIDVTGICTATSFSGSGIGLTSLNADNLGSGEIPNGRFPATLPAVSGANLTDLPVPTRVTVTNQAGDSTCNVLFAQSATGDQLPHTNANLTFNATNGTLTATTFSGSGASLTNIPAGNLTGTVADARISTLTASKLSGALPAISGANLTGIAVTESPVTSYTILGSSSSPNYYLSGGGVDESDNNPDLYLIRGQRYRFYNATGTGHPFRFTVTGNKNDTYSDGVTGSESGTQFFTVPLDAPARIYYVCTIHGSMVGNIYIRGAGGHNDNVGFTTFANKIEVKSSSNTAATFKGSGGAGFINITDADDGTLAFLGVDGGEFKVQTSGNSYSDKFIIKQDGSSYSTGRQYLARAGQAASAQSNMRETFFQNIGTSSSHTFQTGNSYAGGLVYVVGSRFANANYQTTQIFAIAIRSTNNAGLSAAIQSVNGGSGGHSFSVSGASKGITVTNNDSTYSMNCFVTFDITGYTA